MTQWGSPGDGPGQFSSPLGLAIDGAGNVYVADGDLNVIQKFDGTGNLIARWSTEDAGRTDFDETATNRPLRER